MKRTNIVLDEEVVEEAKRLTGIRTTRQVVDEALHQLIRRQKRRELLALRGKVEWKGDLNKMRRARKFS